MARGVKFALHWSECVKKNCSTTDREGNIEFCRRNRERFCAIEEVIRLHDDFIIVSQLVLGIRHHGLRNFS